MLEADGVTEGGDGAARPRRLSQRPHQRAHRDAEPRRRAWLIFLKLRLMRPNFYVLDEPTNHLDIAGQEALEEQLE